MTIMYNGIRFSGGGSKLVLGGKTISKVMYGGKLVYQNALASGTILWSGSLSINDRETKSLTLNDKLKDDWSNLKTGLLFEYAAGTNKGKQSILKENLFKGFRLKYSGSPGPYVDVTISKEDKTISFSPHADAKITKVSVI